MEASKSNLSVLPHSGIFEKQSVHRLLRQREQNFHFSPRLLFSTLQGSEYLWRDLSLDKRLRGHGGCVNSVLFTADGHHVITGSDDTKIKVFSYHSGRCLQTINTIHRANIFFAQELPGSRNLDWIVSCAADGQVPRTSNLHY